MFRIVTLTTGAVEVRWDVVVVAVSAVVVVLLLLFLWLPLGPLLLLLLPFPLLALLTSVLFAALLLLLLRRLGLGSIPVAGIRTSSSPAGSGGRSIASQYKSLIPSNAT
jgi:hypothetical protein